MNYLLPERLDALAREYATGTLAGPARRRFERLLQEQAVAARAVATWQERLAVLAAGSTPLPPREAVWTAVQGRLFGAAVAPAPRPWWQALWSRSAAGSGLAGVLAGLLMAVLVLRVQPGWVGLEPMAESLPASYVGLLSDGAGRPVLLASSRRQGRRLDLKLLQPLVVPAGQVAQLWALPRDGGAAQPVAPLPVGLAVGAPGHIALPDRSEALFFKVDRLGVSLEPAATAPGRRPSGPFVVFGHCVKLW